MWDIDVFFRRWYPTATNVFFLCITESAETIDLYQDGKLLDMIGTTAK